MKKIPPIPQDWYDQNRARFEAETTVAEVIGDKACKHDFKRLSGTRVGCESCPAQWLDPGIVFPFDKQEAPKTS